MRLQGRNVLLIQLFLLGSLVLARVESAQAAGPQTPLSSDVDPVNIQGCPVVCSNYEACIEQRCVDTCRVGCRPGTYCAEDGSCDAVPTQPEAHLTEADLQRLSGGDSATSRVFIFLDVGGIVGFGAKPGIEWGQNNSVVARLHLMNTGVMSYAAYAENEYQRFEWGFGASAAYRHYEGSWGNLRGFYFGGGLDVSVIQISDRVNLGEVQLLPSAAPFGEFGYRWVFGSFAVGFGPMIALRYPLGVDFLQAGETTCDTPESCGDATGASMESSIQVEIGWFQ